MKLTKSSCFTGSLLLVGMLALSSGCGYKTSPVPPQTVVPKAIEDLRYTLDDKGANLTWSYPVQTISGDDISEIQNFELFRAEIPLDDYCSGCPIPFGEPVQLPGGIAAIETRNTAKHYSGLLRSGNKYFFKVKSRTSWWAASADSNIVTFVYHTPAAAPQNVTASPGSSAVSLDWSPVTTLIDGSAADLPLNYQVLRSLDGKQYSRVGKPQPKSTYVDKKVQDGKTYFYKVESSMSFDGAFVEGTASSAVTAKVVDIEPPPMVKGVTVIASATNIRIFWDALDADGLAGYRIYRRIGNDKNVTKVGEVGANQTLFIDKTAPADAKLFYSVTAIDKQENESKRSKETTTRH